MVQDIYYQVAFIHITHKAHVLQAVAGRYKKWEAVLARMMQKYQKIVLNPIINSIKVPRNTLETSV